jgi:radical SAM superfamily enzyme YgiQ (UPF0313 family)
MNLWSRPLGLLHTAEYMSRFDIDFAMIDCMDLYREKKFGTGRYPRKIVKKPDVLRSIPRHFKRYGLDIADFIRRVKSALPCDFVFVTSLMTYWYPGVQKAVEIIKSLTPGTPVILGGLYATLFHEHAVQASGADAVYTGHIKDDIIALLDHFGIRLREKPQDISCSPVLCQSRPFSPVLTSRGCPYRCSYCASPFLSDRFIQKNPEDIIDEIYGLSATGTRDIAFYDDALLVNADAHIKVILRETMRCCPGIRFHCPNGLHARHIDDDLAYLMKQSGFTTLRLSLETINTARQAETGGKVTLDAFVRSVKYLKKHGFTKREIGVYLMYGLPGQGLEEVKEGVHFLKDLGVGINLTEFSPIPHTQCWEELKKQGVIHDGIDPLLTNNTVFPYLFSGYDPDEIDKLKLEVKEYNSYYP